VGLSLRTPLALVVYLVSLTLPLSSWASIASIQQIPNDSVVLVDVRSVSQCQKASLPGARCVPVDDVLAPNHRLINFSSLYWVWGTSGLRGDEHVVVFGDNAQDNYFMAGLLHLSGQSQVSVLDAANEWQSQSELSVGVPRASTRKTVYTAKLRSNSILLRGELEQIIHAENAPVLVDGRAEAEYWGASIRGVRGGHLPGAVNSELTLWEAGAQSASDERLFGDNAVVYAHDTRDTIRFYAWVVSQGLTVGLLLEGWVAWASNAALPLDAEAFPQIVNHRAAARVMPAQDQAAIALSPRSMQSASFLLLLTLLAACAFAVGWYLSKRR